MTTQISFYALQSSTAVSNEAVLNFVCKLTQTALAKSQQSLIIVDDNQERLQLLNTRLWGFEPSSFIPHEIFITDPKVDDECITLADLTAPVTLVTQPPVGFEGLFLNLAGAPIVLRNGDRVLEVIAPDTVSIEQGRNKFRHYRKLDTEISSHIIALKP